MSSITSLEISESSETSQNSRKIFGFFHVFHKFSPHSIFSNRPRPFCYLSTCITVATVLVMLLRVYWQFIEIDAKFLTYGWAESKMFGFLTIESAILTVTLGEMAWARSLENFENSILEIQNLRIERFHKKIDNFRILWCRCLIANLFVFFSFLFTSIYLAVHRKADDGEVKHNSWYWIIDLVAAILCAYSNFLFLPFHVLRSHAIRKEFEVFNLELEKAKITDSTVIQDFGSRQIKLFEFANGITERIERYMIWAPALGILAFIMATFIVSEYSKTPSTVYLICLISMLISTFIISFQLLYPIAFIQEEMLQTSRILLRSEPIQQSNDPLILQSYRILLDRSLHHRSTNNALHIFSVNRKNVERAFFAHTLIIIVMVTVYEFEDGVQKGFEEIGKLMMAKIS